MVFQILKLEPKILVIKPVKGVASLGLDLPNAVAAMLTTTHFNL